MNSQIKGGLYKKKEWNSDTHHNTNFENIMLKEMLVTKDHMLYDSIYAKHPEYVHL